MVVERDDAVVVADPQPPVVVEVDGADVVALSHLMVMDVVVAECDQRQLIVGRQVPEVLLAVEEYAPQGRDLDGLGDAERRIGDAEPPGALVVVAQGPVGGHYPHAAIALDHEDVLVEGRGGQCDGQLQPVCGCEVGGVHQDVVAAVDGPDALLAVDHKLADVVGRLAEVLRCAQSGVVGREPRIGADDEQAVGNGCHAVDLARARNVQWRQRRCARLIAGQLAAALRGEEDAAAHLLAQLVGHLIIKRAPVEHGGPVVDNPFVAVVVEEDVVDDGPLDAQRLHVDLGERVGVADVGVVDSEHALRRIVAGDPSDAVLQGEDAAETEVVVVLARHAVADVEELADMGVEKIEAVVASDKPDVVIGIRLHLRQVVGRQHLVGRLVVAECGEDVAVVIAQSVHGGKPHRAVGRLCHGRDGVGGQPVANAERA